MYHVYISVSGEDRIARFAMNPETGALIPGEDIALSGRPAYAAMSPDNRIMYVARKGSLQVTSFEVDAKSGDLSEIGTVPIL